jgi:hypothetical protein
MISCMPTALRWLTSVATALTLLATAGCGGSGDDARRKPTTAGTSARKATPTPSATPSAAADAAVDPAHKRVIRAWADTLRHGDINGAARYFALPSLVSNGTTPIKLETRAEARFFNATLPCGAIMIATEPAPQHFVIATFRLTERPGKGQCGGGVGATARTAFRIRRGHITDWLRVPDEPQAPGTQS